VPRITARVSLFFSLFCSIAFRIWSLRSERTRKAVGSIADESRRFAWGESACCSKILPLHARGLIHHPQPTLLQPVRTIIRRQVNVKWKSIEGQWGVTSPSSFTRICSILYVKPQICWTGHEGLRPKYYFRCLLHDTCPSSFSASPNSSILCRC